MTNQTGILKKTYRLSFPQSTSQDLLLGSKTPRIRHVITQRRRDSIFFVFDSNFRSWPPFFLLLCLFSV